MKQKIFLRIKLQKKLILLLPFFIALFIRLFYVSFVNQIDVACDASDYDRLGWSLSQGKGYITNGEPDIYWAPGYPFILAIIYKFFGRSYFAIRVFQAFVSSLLVVIVGLLATKIFNRKIGFISSMFVALYPGFIGYTGLILTETTFTFLLAIIIYFFLTLDYGTYLKKIILGAIISFASLVRSGVILLPLFILFTKILFTKNKMQILKQFVVIYLVIGIIILPWAIRNYKVTGEFIPFTVHDADSFWISSYEKEWLEFYPDKEPYKSMNKGRFQLERAHVLRNEGIKNILTRPGVYVKLCFKRIPRFWFGSHSNLFSGMTNSFGGYIKQGKSLIVLFKAIFLMANLIFIFLGFYGIYISFLHNRNKDKTESKILLILPILYIALIHFFIFATLRYQIPIIPYMLIFAAVGFDRILKKLNFGG